MHTNQLVKLEVSKKYRSHITGKMYTCVGFNTKGNPIFEDSDGYVFVGKPDDWTEYKEPIKIKKWMGLMQDPRNGEYRCYSYNEKPSGNYLFAVKEIEIEFTEGEGLE